jgi:hypothetical protein
MANERGVKTRRERYDGKYCSPEGEKAQKEKLRDIRIKEWRDPEMRAKRINSRKKWFESPEAHQAKENRRKAAEERKAEALERAAEARKLEFERITAERVKIIISDMETYPKSKHQARAKRICGLLGLEMNSARKYIARVINSDIPEWKYKSRRSLNQP